jgi:hypothetical protein
MSTSIKATVALNVLGQVVAASQPVAQSDVTSGMVADLGQTLVEVEVSASVADMDADKLFAHLAEHASVKAASTKFAAVPASSGQEVTSGTI